MVTKFYTQFQVDASSMHRNNVFSGIVELKRGDPAGISAVDIEHMLAERFDLDIDQLSLVNWYRLH
ncbi:MAG: hypothetical protein AAFO81_00190 [Pseudomonadota bacterium]